VTDWVETVNEAPETEGQRRTRPELPDPALFWQWVGRATRPVWGWILVGLGFLAVIIGYLGISREALVAKQLPYLISGGIGGIALVGFGAMLVGTEDLKRTQERVDHLERLVHDLHSVLLTRPDAPAYGELGSSNGEVGDPGVAVDRSRTLFLALPQGQTFHRAECSMIQGKRQAEQVSPTAAKRRGLKPCRLCEPESAAYSA
jgi:hypothetical protein